MKLLVITPTLGTSRWLDETVASVADLAADARHVLVCPQRVELELARKFPGLSVVSEIRPGLYPAINRGLVAIADWHAFTWLNDDDVLVKEGFRVALNQLTVAPDADVSYGRVDLIGSAGQRLGALPVARHARDLPSLLARGIMPLAQPGTIIRRRCWEKLGGLDESYQLAGDLDFFVRALAAGVSFAYCHETLAAFRLRADQLSKRRAEMERETERALRPLRAAPSPWSARLRFRADNLGVYFERVRRHGWISMRELYDRAE